MRTLTAFWQRIRPGGSPLVRTSDRIEAVLTLTVLLAALLAIPFAATMGSDIYADRMAQATEQATDRRPVTAVLLADAPPVAIRLDGVPIEGKSRVPARWIDGDVVREEPVDAGNGSVAGQEVEIWLDSRGDVVPAPVTRDDAARNGIGVGVGVWLGCVALLAVVFLIARSALARRRDAAWSREWRRVADDWTPA
ncbi:hypothetical protein LCL61_18595 [Amycolatopsis coloradensis]|uniref:Uncharacterized protein n=1 Tax=Amycolatopsis coloradensis TaxID=76021 RepID=A0ACD5BDY0_9PSEU